MRSSASIRSWGRTTLLGLLALIVVGTGWGALTQALRLSQMPAPWAYAGATLDPRLIPTLTQTLSPAPPTDTPTPRPTALSLGRTCADNPLIIERVRPKPDTVILIGQTLLAATVHYCLGTMPQAQVGVGLIPWGPEVEPVFISFAELSVVNAGEGRVTEGIQWGEFVFDRPPPAPGQYRFVAVMVDEFGNLLSSVASDEYTFVGPTPTPLNGETATAIRSAILTATPTRLRPLTLAPTSTATP
jgi:hypothetical protein